MKLISLLFNVNQKQIENVSISSSLIFIESKEIVNFEVIKIFINYIILDSFKNYFITNNWMYSSLVLLIFLLIFRF